MGDMTDRLAAWREVFDQSIDQETLESFVGKRVEATRTSSDGQTQAVTTNWVGFGWMVIGQDDEKAIQWTVLTDEGSAFPVFKGMTFKAVEATS